MRSNNQFRLALIIGFMFIAMHILIYAMMKRFGDVLLM
jgi:hypothetical protein